MIGPLLRRTRSAAVLVGPETGDDAGVFRLGDQGLVATADFITPVCDDARRFGRIAAANAMSDVWAMGGRPLFALNLCAFPSDAPVETLAEILDGAGDALVEAGAVLLGGHTIKDRELKFGLAVVGVADPDRLLTNTGARAGDRLLLTKPLGTGAMVNAYRVDALDSAGLEPVLVEMERLNAEACRLALAHGARAATDITGFGLAGHALALAEGSRVGLRVRFDALPRHAAYFDLVRTGITTGCNGPNRRYTVARIADRRGLDAVEEELLFDPQTSGGLLIAVAPIAADRLLADLLAGGHAAAEIGEVLAGVPRLEIL